MDGLADPVQRDAVAGGEGVQAAYSGNDVPLEGDVAAGGQFLDDADGSVVERGVAPDENGADAVLLEFFGDHPLEDLGASVVPVLHRLAVGGGGAVALGVGGLDETVVGARGSADVALADLAAQLDQVVLGAALVDQEEHVHRVQGLDGLDGDVVGVAGPDPDEQYFPH